jgi:predicted 3-demethylubiquinone-9 3-methyltransferase (glyoxalase superfamily)
MSVKKIVPGLWFTAEGGKISQVLEYYLQVFRDDFSAGETIPLGTTPSGNAEMCEAEIFGQRFSFLCTEKPHHSFNDAVSFTIHCKNQEEIDKYWDYFTREGEESQCGWCMDKFGVRWQIVPENLGELMSQPGAYDVMMAQKKIIIAEYFKHTES